MVSCFVLVYLLQSSPSGRRVYSLSLYQEGPYTILKLLFYRFIFFFFKNYESVLKKEVWKHFKSSGFISDHPYCFNNKCSPFNHLSNFSDSWSFSLRLLGKIFILGLGIWKDFERIWYTIFISKLSSFGFYLYFCSNLFLLLFQSFYSSCSKSINSYVSYSSVLLPILFLLFINNHVSLTSSHIHSYTGYSSLIIHFNFKKDLLNTNSLCWESGLGASDLWPLTYSYL